MAATEVVDIEQLQQAQDTEKAAQSKAAQAQAELAALKQELAAFKQQALQNNRKRLAEDSPERESPDGDDAKSSRQE
jgi:hypothetical protein